MEQLLTLRDVQSLTRLSRSQIYSLVQERQLPAVRMAKTRRIMVRPEDLRRFVEAGLTVPAPINAKSDQTVLVG